MSNAWAGDSDFGRWTLHFGLFWMPTRATPAIKKPEPAPKPPAPAPRPPAPAPAAATAPRAAAGPPAVRLGTPAPKVGAAVLEGAVAPGVVELKGMSDFKPAAPVAAFLDANKTSTINARFGDLAQGPLEVKTAGKGKYRVKKQPLPLSHPAFAFVPQFVPGLTPALILGVENNKLSGEVGLASGAKVQRISSFIQKTPDMLGLAGFTIGALPTIVNAIEGGSLHFGLKAVPIKLGSAFSGKFNFDVIDTNVSFDANAAVVVKGLANGTLDLKRAPSGLITGRAAIGLSLSKNFSGSVDVAWDGVAITGIGKVGYKGEKFSGEVTLQMMERNQALQLAQSKQSPPAGAAKAAAAKKPVKIDYVVFGEGDLNFSFTEWLSGTAHVIVDPKGNVTVIGKITPQKDFILFPQKDYIRPLFKFEARASYGIPVVGNIFIFANVGMDLFAKLGPAKFYNIVVDGTYSTDPTVAKNFTIQGSLNISAAAGAQLRAEAGAGPEIFSHDIKAGAGINGIAGIKAYAETTPVIGYREKAVEGQDMKGEWFVRGDLELAAQPFLGLSGDLFVEISTPWWSPLSDHRWTWPLFSKEWPLGSSMGMLVSVDYVFGSGQWPKFDLKPVEFDSNKFITGLYDDSAKSGPGKELQQKGKWQKKNSPAAQPPPKGTQTGSAKPGKLDSGKAKTKQAKAKKLDKAVDPNAKTKEGKSVKQLQADAQKKGKGPKGKDISKDGKDSKDGAVPIALRFSKHKPFSADGEQHEFWVSEDGELQVASKAMSLATRIAGWKRRVAGLDKADQPTATSMINQAATLSGELRKAAQDAVKARKAGNVTAVDAAQKIIDTREADLQPILAKLFHLFGDVATEKGAADEARIFALVEVYDQVVVPLKARGLVGGTPGTVTKTFKSQWNRKQIPQARGWITQMERVLAVAKNVGTGRVPYLVAVELKIPGTEVDYTVRDKDVEKQIEFDIAVEVKHWGAMRERTSKGGRVISVTEQIGNRINTLRNQVESALKHPTYSVVVVELRGYDNIPDELRDAVLDEFKNYAGLAATLNKRFTWRKI